MKFRHRENSDRRGLFKNPAPIELTVNILPDGGCPPRIVFPHTSIWLMEGREAVEIIPGIVAQNVGGKCILLQTKEKANININSQRLFGRQVLRDGDFIYVSKNRNKKVRGIFQADPAADHRKLWMEDPFDLQSTVQLTKRLAQYVMIDREGVSLDGGKTTASWLEVNAIVIYKEHQTGKWSIHIRVGNMVAKERKLPSKFKSSVLSAEEIDLILKWAHYNAPFMLSIEEIMLPELPDAYITLAYIKITTPIEEHKRTPPASPAFIFNLRTRGDTIMGSVAAIIMSALVSLMIGGIATTAFSVPFGIAFAAVFVVGLILQVRWFRDAFAHLRHLHEYETLDLSAWTKMGD